MIGRRLESLEQNMAENKVVWMEIRKSTFIKLYLTNYELVQTEKEEASPQCYKTSVGLMIPQTLDQVKDLIDKRGNALQREIE